MKRLVLIGGGVLVSAAVTAGLGAGVAGAAPDLRGAIWKDAKGQLAQMGLSPVVKTRTGDRVRDDQCVVGFIQDAPGADGKVFVDLNCYADVASRYGPGYSAQTPQGRAAKEAREQAAAKKAEEEAAAAAQQQTEAADIPAG